MLSRALDFQSDHQAAGSRNRERWKGKERKNNIHTLSKNLSYDWINPNSKSASQVFKRWDFLQLVMRIVSFLPSATETLYELGAGNQIVGVTHECNYPSQARKKPQVIRSSFDPGQMTGRDIDNKIVELMRTGKDIYIVDENTLKESRLILLLRRG